MNDIFNEDKKFWLYSPVQPKDIKAEVYGPALNTVNRIIKYFKLYRSVALRGPPGTGKTLLAERVAKEMDLELLEIQMNPGMTRSVLDRSYMPTGNGIKTIKQAMLYLMVNGGILFLDEYTQAPPDIQAYLNFIFEANVISIDNKTYPVNPNFHIIIAFNPPETSRASKGLTETIQNRIGATITVNYPTYEEAITIASHFSHEPGALLAAHLYDKFKESLNLSIRQLINMAKFFNTLEYGDRRTDADERTYKELYYIAHHVDLENIEDALNDKLTNKIGSLIELNTDITMAIRDLLPAPYNEENQAESYIRGLL